MRGAIILDLSVLFSAIAGRPVLGLAVSGGADSLALLLLAAEWAKSLVRPPRLTVYSVDHGLRPEAAAEAAFVAGEAARLGLPCRVLRWSGEKPAAGVQAAARAARYRLMGEAMRRDGVEVLLTAHHRDDQAETVLMRLAHGSGLGGLRGMDSFAEIDGVTIFRPFLGLPRATLGEVVAAAGLVPVADPSNEDRHYERVRWRQAMPVVAGLGLDSAALATLARRAGDADAAIAEWAAAAFAANVRVDGFGAATLPSEALSHLPRAVGVKLLGTILARVGGDRRPHALASLERLHQRLVAEGTMPRLTMLGVALSRRGDDLWFVREPGRQAPSPARLGPRESLFWDRRFRIDNCGASPVDIQVARAMSRREAEGLLGQSLATPVLAIRSAPVVRDGGGRLLALGAHRFDDSVAIVFSPEYCSLGTV